MLQSTLQLHYCSSKTYERVRVRMLKHGQIVIVLPIWLVEIFFWEGKEGGVIGHIRTSAFPYSNAVIIAPQHCKGGKKR